VFAKAFLSIGQYKHQGSLLSWLYRITVNVCYEYLRRKRNKPLLYEADLADDDARVPDARSAAPGADRTLADRDLALKLLAHVSERERTLLLLREVEGYSIEELARATGVNGNTLKVILFRARKKLLRAAGRYR
jgi:RNA polymerase sigma-70 factor (ECF subfamily)